MCMTFSSFSLLGSEHFILHVIFNLEERRLECNRILACAQYNYSSTTKW